MQKNQHFCPLIRLIDERQKKGMQRMNAMTANAISEVSESQANEERETPEEDVQAQLIRELASLRKQLAHVENLLDQQATEGKIR